MSETELTSRLTPDGSVDWTEYYNRFDKSKKRMERLLKRLARRFKVPAKEVYEESIDDYGFRFCVERREDEKVLDVSFTIWDSGDADDGIRGRHGNFNLNIVETGGRIVGGIVPNNYTDAVWVDYLDDDEWEVRLTGIENSEEEIFECISNWRKGS